MSLWKVRSSLAARRGPSVASYRVPAVWTGDLQGITEVDPYAWMLSHVDELLARPAYVPSREAGWSQQAYIYNLFVRTAAAYDHDGDGILGGNTSDPTINSSGFRETGTFLKALCMLKHIARLGVDTVYLLPITAIGRANRKGILGSPYAMRNPYLLDEGLSDPLVPDLSVDDQCAAFTEAAHRLGMRVVLEFVFRTAAQDSDWVREHPDWFYWIKSSIPDRSDEHPEGYGNPSFSAEDMKLIRQVAEDSSGTVRTPAQVAEVLARGEGKLVPPPASYRAMYTTAPATVTMDEDSYWQGTLENGTTVRIPGAFADWPPDDIQPPWTDVTYLRMYGKPVESDFNYMAYNTIRLYDPSLATEERINRDLWETIAQIVPSYQERFGIDGVMIDMGHALPVELARSIQDRARRTDPGFAFWEEKFFLDPDSPGAGYEAVVGPGPFTLPNHTYTTSWIQDFTPPPVSFFATGENHNTPRIAAGPLGSKWVKAAWALGMFLPGAIPFIHNGVEVYETRPINTGLGFSPQDLKRLADTPLGLFDAASFSWDDGGQDMIPFIMKTATLHRRHRSALSDRRAESYRVLSQLPRPLIGYERCLDGQSYMAVIANPSTEERISCTLPTQAQDVPTGRVLSGTISVDQGEVLVLDYF